MASGNDHPVEGNGYGCCECQRWEWMKGLPIRIGEKPVAVGKKMKKLGQDDPRRIIHSVKVGVAITLVSLLYYFEPLFAGFGASAMWAVLTVVVVFEFYVGATLGKGLNRGLATLVAGALGVFAHELASLSGKSCKPVLLGLFVFLLAASVTFLRFYPRLKARYDYGLLVFILTFSMISVSGYRDEEVLGMAHQRLSTILIGGATAVIVCILICPVWAGNDLHNSVASNLEKLGSFLEGYGVECFKVPTDGDTVDQKTAFQEYKSVLNSKNTEESLVNFAKWEPPHGKFRFRHPWKQYLKIGTLTRQCAYRIEALTGYLNAEFQAPLEIQRKIQESCTEMSSESGKVLKELASAIKTMTQPSCTNPHIANSRTAAKTLKSSLKTSLYVWEDTNILELIPMATVASLLIDIVSCTEKISEAVHELASHAHFKTADPPTETNSGMDGIHHVIKIDGSSTCIE
ncbi:aluminum-activated malate transporter 2-like [Malania oleifera]|uniref:aluminum-activated malate transporter 2-like n=1 Tax=Malania oleifera TaxID=397392 RepID=UPI0025AEC41A|nr:aluminum-activated malate transporter 2-like [Malania oleifera]